MAMAGTAWDCYADHIGLSKCGSFLAPLRPCPPSPPPRQVADTQRLVRYVDDAVGRSAKAFEVQALRR